MNRQDYTAEEWEAMPKKFDLFCKIAIENNVKNQIRGYLRHCKRYKVVSTDELSELLEGICDEYFSEKTELRAGDESIFLESMELAEAIRKLPERKQIVLLLAVALGYSMREIAVKLNITERTAINYKYQALKLLREEMNGEAQGSK